ncbi:hypothetical protein I7F96_32195 [Sinorhizobium meliloti]|uniref:hypothetical protein n=1 Tax=Rhizobium meliloti TaxID=382 RepID=UPI0018630C18|nr:hypothetical protein [Sinorhizobium meliloti]MDE3775425.1 hypothetical protein [Sinorhizobium meliloti]QND34685.1 hypothetical protein HB772_22145 [Sinorhizobium meliloti]
MKEFLEILAKLWTAISRLPSWAQIISGIFIAVIAVEAAQEALLGSGLFWVAARLAPWPQIFEPDRAIATKFEVRAPGAEGPVDANGIPCPVGSDITLTYARSADGWVAVAGWNDKEGLYPISAEGVVAQPIDKGVTYPIPFKITSSAGAEYFIVIGKSKPFEAKRYMDMVTKQLKGTANVGKGGAPQLRSADLGAVEAGRLGWCMSLNRGTLSGRGLGGEVRIYQSILIALAIAKNRKST